MSDDAACAVRRGGCQCGAIRYELHGPVLRLYVCHCSECRKQSASAFGVSVFVEPAALRLTQGEPKLWSRPTDSGNVLECAFCPTCGSRLWHRRLGDATMLSIKAGSLDDPVDLTGAVHIWTSRMLAGISLPEGAKHFPYGPE